MLKSRTVLNIQPTKVSKDGALKLHAALPPDADEWTTRSNYFYLV